MPGDLRVDRRFVGDDFFLDVGRHEVELDGHHALAGRVLQVFEHALVARVVGDDQAEAGGSLEGDPEPVNRELSPVVGQRVEYHGGVLSSFDDLIEVADCSFLNRPGERAVDPDRLPALKQVAPDKVSRGEIFVAGDGDQLAAQVVGHGLDEAGLATSGRAFQQQRQALAISGGEDLFFVTLGQIKGPSGHVAPFPVVVRDRLSNRCRWASRRCKSADVIARRNKGPIWLNRSSSWGALAWAAVPNTRRRAWVGVVAPSVRHKQPMPWRRVSARAWRASASA